MRNRGRRSQQCGAKRAPEATSRLANHPLTRAYLEAGVRLLDREFDASLDGTDRFVRPLGTLTRDTVIAEVGNGPAELPRQGTVGSFRDRWSYFPDYVADPARYTLREYHSAPANVLARTAAGKLLDKEFAAAVHEIGYESTVIARDSTALRFRFLAVALAAQDEHIRETMTRLYHDITDTWQQLCSDVFAARGLRLRDGIGFTDLATILTALNEGLALRDAHSPGTGILDDERRRSLVGLAALALFAGAADTGDGRSVAGNAEHIAGKNDSRAADRE
ncbi:hypothetical protein [Sciscionella marina]|uniref:hypothetical protein n=1 Tax=Sciscionella marina TaxID=508770 RepID=UPI000372075A|nr:hypothetical protein [Sciscionella marina]